MTGGIDTATTDSIKLTSADGLHQDIIITARGLKVKLAGGLQTRVDGEELCIPDHYMWKGLMIEGLPNLTFSFGYTDAS